MSPFGAVRFSGVENGDARRCEALGAGPPAPSSDESDERRRSLPLPLPLPLALCACGGAPECSGSGSLAGASSLSESTTMTASDSAPAPAPASCSGSGFGCEADGGRGDEEKALLIGEPPYALVLVCDSCSAGGCGRTDATICEEADGCAGDDEEQLSDAPLEAAAEVWRWNTGDGVTGNASFISDELLIAGVMWNSRSSGWILGAVFLGIV